MTAPPGLEPITQAVSASESERCEGASDLSTMKAKMLFLVDELGCTHIQAHHYIRGYERDCEDAIRVGNDTGRSDVDFLAYLMRELPLGLTHGIDAQSRAIRVPRGQEAR